MAATLKDDGYSGFKEITPDRFGDLIAAIEAGRVDVVVVRDIDRLARNLTDWNQFEKACVRHGMRLCAYTGGDLDLSTPEGAYYGGMENAAGQAGKRGQSARVRGAADQNARKGKRAGSAGSAYPDLRQSRGTGPQKRTILRQDINPVEADAIRDAAVRVLEHREAVGSIARDWIQQGIKPAAAKQWWPTSLVGTLTSARIVSLREWQGEKYPTT